MAPGANFCPGCGCRTSPLSPPAPSTKGGGPPPVLPPRYEVVRFLGRGGMGRVYLCRDTTLDVEVAIKVLPQEVVEEADSREQIQREARAAAKFRDCTGILVLYGFEQFGDVWYLVMEFASGGSLHERIRQEGRLSEEDCRRLGGEVAEALSFAHQRRILHRDIKPANILLDGKGRAKVADFGIAKVLSENSARVSATSVAGTPVYMAPEIILRGKIDGRTDLYALGCMLFEMSTGRLPFTGSFGEIALAKTMAQTEVPDPRAVRPELSEEFGRIVRRLMAHEPEDRYPDAGSAALALRGLAPQPTITGPMAAVRLDDGAAGGEGDVPVATPARPARAAPPPAPPPPPAPRRGGGLLVAGGLLAVAAAGAAFFFLGRGSTPTPGPGPSPAPSPAPPPAPAPPDPAPAPGPSGKGTAGPVTPPAPEPKREEPPAPPVELEVKKPEPPPPPPPAPAPKPPAGLLVFTDPPGATVTVDGVERGAAGAEGLFLAGMDGTKPHAVKAWLADHEPAEETGVSWEAGERREVRLRLERLRGRFSASGVPAGASLVLERAGAPPLEVPARPDGTAGPVAVDAGEYEVVLAKEGSEPGRQKVRIVAGRETRQVFDAASLRPAMGTLSVSTDPPGAEVREGNEVLGMTPLAPRRIAAGTHHLLLVHPDTDDLSQDVEVPAGKAVDLRGLRLPPLATLDPSGLPGGVTATVGGKPVTGPVARKSGDVAVVLTRQGFRPQTIRLTLRSGATTPVPAGTWVPSAGRLLVRGLPAGARVLLDGRVLDPAAAAAGVETDAGPHAVAFEKPGSLGPGPAEVTVAPEETVTVEAPRFVEVAVPGLPAPPARDFAGARIPAGIVEVGGRLVREKDGAEMVLLPAGEFWMGRDDGEEDERPAHRVALPALLVDRHEVTNAQFRRFVEGTGHRTDAEKAGKGWVHRGEKGKEAVEGADWRHPEGPRSSLEGRDRHPVVLVSWNDAVAYAGWAGVRLPTEAEFEMALRGGLDRRKFPWGEERVPAEKPGNFADESARRVHAGWKVFEGYDDRFPGTAPAGSFAANPLGLLDAAGNVTEWCLDFYAADWYRASPAEDPRGPAAADRRVIRGAAWTDAPVNARASNRDREDPAAAADDLGFRCVVRPR